ncbi:MAG: ABC transporter ATP-binding protein [Thermodesulfovibrionales bacterium]
MKPNGEKGPNEALIRLRAVRKVFRSGGASFEALREVDLEIESGDFVAITGESGSGKSTLLSVLGGIAPPDGGSVAVDGIDVYGLSIERLADFRREYIGFVFQQFHLIPYLTALENVMLPLSIVPGRGKAEMAAEVLGKVGLAGKARSLPSQLSGGEQQRVAIARALVNNPPLILADEPTGNLDTRTGEEIFGLFQALNMEGRTVVMVTHNPLLAARARRVVEMKDGLPVRSGGPAPWQGPEEVLQGECVP